MFSLRRSPRLCQESAERDKYEGRLSRSAASVDAVGPQMFPLMSAMALIKFQVFLSPCLLAPLHCPVTGAGEAVVGGVCSELPWEIRENSRESTRVI